MPVFAHEDEWATTRDKDVIKRIEGTGPVAVSILFVAALCNCGVRVRGVFLVAFDIQAYQAVLVKGNFGHPLGPGVGFQLDLDVPQVW